MANWLEKIIPKQPPAARPSDLPAQRSSNSGLPYTPLASAPAPAKLPNATIIYAVAASALFVIALFFLFSGRWFTGFLVLLPAVCFLGFALHFLRHPQ